MSGDVPPCQTIYVNRLNEKIKKDGARSAHMRSSPARGSPAAPSLSRFPLWASGAAGSPLARSS